MDQLAANYERLRRKVVRCEDASDPIDLFELSHSLRLWTELKGDLLASNSEAGSHLYFKSASPSKAACKILRTAESVSCIFPQPVRTAAFNRDLGGVPLNAKQDGSEYNISMTFKLLDDQSNQIEGSKFTVIKRRTPDDESKKLNNHRVKRCNYVNWLGSEVVRITFVDDSAQLSFVSLSREQVVKRMANAFGGSHQWNISNDYSNSADRIIRELFNHQVMGMPLPYLILLNTGQCILEAFSKHVIVGGTV